MILLKLILVLIFSIAVLVLTLSDRYQTGKRIMFLASYVFIVALIVSPTLADDIAHFFSIQHGSDLVIYVSISVLGMVSAINYARGDQHLEVITKLVRELAIKDVKKT